MPESVNIDGRRIVNVTASFLLKEHTSDEVAETIANQIYKFLDEGDFGLVLGIEVNAGQVRGDVEIEVGEHEVYEWHEGDPDPEADDDSFGG